MREESAGAKTVIGVAVVERLAADAAAENCWKPSEERTLWKRENVWSCGDIIGDGVAESGKIAVAAAAIMKRERKSRRRL